MSLTLAFSQADEPGASPVPNPRQPGREGAVVGEVDGHHSAARARETVTHLPHAPPWSSLLFLVMLK